MASAEVSSPTPKSSPFRRRDVAPAPRVDWYEWRDWFAREWKQDEHLSLIGPTGTGKTALAVDLIRIRSFRVFVMTKPADDKLERALQRQGYLRVPAFPREPPDDVDRYLLWPNGSGDLSANGLLTQRTILHDAFVKIFRGPQGGAPGRWCICLDEARYVSDPSFIGLQRDVKQLLIQGRSLRIAMVLNYQRPSWVPAEAYDQVSHLFIAHDNDRRNIQRFREIGGVDGETVAATVQKLRQFEWAHVDARPGKGEIKIIRMPKGL